MIGLKNLKKFLSVLPLYCSLIIRYTKFLIQALGSAKATLVCPEAHVKFVNSSVQYRNEGVNLPMTAKKNNYCTIYELTKPNPCYHPKSDIDLGGPVDCGISYQKKLVSNQKMILS